MPVILFDKDGVLVDSMPAHFLAYKKYFDLHHVPYSRDDWNALIGRSTQDTMLALKEKYGFSMDARDATRDKELIAEQLLSAGTPLFPGVHMTLEELSSFPMGLVTSSTRKMLDFDFHNKSLFGYFKAIVTAEDITHSKPDPECYVLGAKRMGASPQDCVVVEDSHLGVEAAKRAQMKCIGITNSMSAAKLRDADVIIEDMREITPALVYSLVS
jgi:beta-phosphoglucomutase